MVRSIKRGANVGITTSVRLNPVFVRSHQQDQYTIDLTYITERVIGAPTLPMHVNSIPWVAMSFPAEGMESTYRNRLDDVARHLHDRHAGHFMIFNLSERPYNYSKFQDRVADWCGFPDHHPPPLALLFRIVKAMEAFLCADANNVVVVHCLAGTRLELLALAH